jgi:hypothetical protein
MMMFWKHASMLRLIDVEHIIETVYQISRALYSLAELAHYEHCSCRGIVRLSREFSSVISA